jgi:hypothetical protein
MEVNNDLIARLGFDAWADNLIVNTLEDSHAMPYKAEDEHGTVVSVERHGENLHALVRAYDSGWQTHERIIKNVCK